MLRLITYHILKLFETMAIRWIYCLLVVLLSMSCLECTVPGKFDHIREKIKCQLKRYRYNCIDVCLTKCA